MDNWVIEDAGGSGVALLRSGVWQGDFRDEQDAIGYLRSQRVRGSVTITEADGYRRTVRL